MVTRPPGSRRATTTPAAAVSVSRSPARHPSTMVTARSATRPDASIRPNPYRTSPAAAGIPGTAARGSRRSEPAPARPRTAARARGGIRGATGQAVTAASPGEEPGRPGGAAGSRRGQAASLRVRAVSGLGEISPVWVSEGGLGPVPGWYITETVIHHHPKLAQPRAGWPASRRRGEAAASAGRAARVHDLRKRRERRPGTASRARAGLRQPHHQAPFSGKRDGSLPLLSAVPAPPAHRPPMTLPPS
jgi:hypothetical protein